MWRARGTGHLPSPEAVFAVLADPRRYAYFVVGTKKIRRFEPRRQGARSARRPAAVGPQPRGAQALAQVRGEGTGADGYGGAERRLRARSKATMYRMIRNLDTPTCSSTPNMPPWGTGWSWMRTILPSATV